MANYIGAHCPVCEKRFADGDDIVVCPICGTPHHRACYQLHGKCAKDERHQQGYSWEPPVQAPKEKTAGEQKICPVCKGESPQHCLFCQTCGARLGDTDAAGSQDNNAGHRTASGYTPPVINAYTMAFGGLSPEEKIQDVSVRDLANYVGPNAQYFLPQFKLLAHKAGISLNFSSLIFSFFYFFYRKMHLLGAVLLGLILFSQIPLLLIMPEFFEFFALHLKDILLGIDVMPLYQPQNHLWVYRISGILQYIPFLLTIVFSFFCNRMYLFHAVKSIQKAQKIREQSSTALNDHDYSLLLAKRGRTSMMSVLFIVVVLIVGYFAISYYFASPYQDMITSAVNSFLSSS